MHLERFSDVGPDPEAPVMVMVIEFRLDEQPFRAINGGPRFPFTGAISPAIFGADQGEVDRYWGALIDGGEPGRSAWRKNRRGVSWRVAPRELNEPRRDADREDHGHVMPRLPPMDTRNLAEARAAADAAA